jgi:hypothetical protein
MQTCAAGWQCKTKLTGKREWRAIENAQRPTQRDGPDFGLGEGGES